MPTNPLRYDEIRPSSFGRKARECLPCIERELFIKECAENGESTIGIRQKNRYIDEFLRFVNEKYGFYAPKKLTKKHFDAYQHTIIEDKYISNSTKSNKISKARIWLQWLYARGDLKHSCVV